VPDGTLLFHLLLVIVMVAVVNATLLKPINRILAERERKTKGRLSEAQGLTQKVEQELREYERRLREARSEGYSLMERERQTVAGERDRRLTELRAQISEQLMKERQKLLSETEQAKVVLEKDAQSLAMEISQQILHRPVAGQGTT
jgi:F-type H+-transporting ATPase subunit b